MLLKLKRKREEICETSDRISNLPNNVTQQILEYLPLKEAAKTSILSSHWRYIWDSTSQLIFDQAFFSSVLDEELETAAYSKVVNSVLLGHVGPVHKFVLYLPQWFFKDTDTIMSWMQYVRANGVKELTLEGDRSFKSNPLPACLFFTCVGLTHLTLTNCGSLNLPLTFRGFPRLVYLKFEYCEFCVTSRNKEKALENLISNCPLLECLRLNISGFRFDLTVCPPKLHDLCLEGLIDLSVNRSLAMKRVELNVLCHNFQKSRNTGVFFSSLTKVEELILSPLFWMGILRFKFTYPDKFPKDLVGLQNLQLVEIPTKCGHSISFVHSLLRISPNLELLSLVARNDVQTTDEIQIDDSCSLNCLKNVQLINISGLNNDLQLIKFILASSPMLREMSIEFGIEMTGAEEKYRFAKELSQYSRASPHAQVILKEKEAHM